MIQTTELLFVTLTLPILLWAPMSTSLISRWMMMKLLFERALLHGILSFDTTLRRLPLPPSPSPMSSIPPIWMQQDSCLDRGLEAINPRTGRLPVKSFMQSKLTSTGPFHPRWKSLVIHSSYVIFLLYVYLFNPLLIAYISQGPGVSPSVSDVLVPSRWFRGVPSHASTISQHACN